MAFGNHPLSHRIPQCSKKTPTGMNAGELRFTAIGSGADRSPSHDPIPPVRSDPPLPPGRTRSMAAGAVGDGGLPIFSGRADRLTRWMVSL